MLLHELEEILIYQIFIFYKQLSTNSSFLLRDSMLFPELLKTCSSCKLERQSVASSPANRNHIFFMILHFYVCAYVCSVIRVIIMIILCSIIQRFLFPLLPCYSNTQQQYVVCFI